MRYTAQGPHAIVLIDPTTATADVLAFAQRHADATGHVCEVFAPDGCTVLAQVTPTPSPAVQAPATLLGGVTGWLERNVRDPGDES